jgi:2-hydroxychromene-2-carboxylate isomerase
VDRLHYLESRLRALGVAKTDNPTAIFAPPTVPLLSASHTTSERPILHWYLSFRSPYTGIVADRVKALADAYGAELRLRYVLPMVMRGMRVPRMKGFYIMSDTVREAERLGVPFGNMSDPVGRPVERGYAILHKAIELGKGCDFVRSFLSGVWAEGIDAGSDRGLKEITERAGLAWAEMQPLLGGDHWRAAAEANQAEMFSHGIWGVPSFRVGDTAIWGQDRLWVIEDALATEQDKTI